MYKNCASVEIILPKSVIKLPNNNGTHMYDFPFISLYIYNNIALLTNTIIFSNSLISQHYVKSWFHLVKDKIEHDWDFQHNIVNNTHTMYITHVLALQSCIQFVKYSTSFFNTKNSLHPYKTHIRKRTHKEPQCLCNKTETYASKSS